MNPEQILAAMAEMYATCTTYRDAGRVVIRWPHAEGPHNVSIRPFETAFVRPGRFRFEFRDRYSDDNPWYRYIVWTHGMSVRTWWDVTPGVEEPESLSLALAGATGVSGGSAHTIPALLLLGQISGQRLTDMIEVTALEDADLAGVGCYRLHGSYGPNPMDPTQFERLGEEFFRLTGQRLPRLPENSLLTVWIDRGTFLVRRIEEQSGFVTDGVTGVRTHATEEVTEYNPEVGGAVSEDHLRFDPPTFDGVGRTREAGA